MLITGTEIVCPAGDPGTPPLVIDLRAILAAEQRQEEVATVTAFKAPELLKTFNRNWLDLSEVLARLVLEKAKAEKALEKRRSILILEVVPATLAAKKLPSNEANREAIIQLDAEFDRLSDTLNEIVAVKAYLEGKLKSFENAFTSVKKVLGMDQQYMRPGSNSNLSGGTGGGGGRQIISQPPPANDQTTKRQVEDNARPPPRGGFGKARYGS
jgi:hypothetical protein